ncbi:MAG: acetyltransferase [Clostridia bacterium]|nr:acetyltransferase [Clostridia bacterium]
MEFQIREMKETDWEQVCKIYKQGMDSNLATFQIDVPTYGEWDIGHLKICRFVAVKNDDVIGWAALLPTSSRKAYEGVVELSLYIDENNRRCGVGSCLMKHIFQETEKNGIWTIQSLIMQNNEPSINMHIKNGFREVGYRYKIAQDKFGNWRNTVIYERRSKNPIFD